MSEKRSGTKAGNGERLTLAGGFPSASTDAWKGLVQRILGDRSFEDVLVRKTYDGIPVRPLYTAGDWQAVDEPSGFPGLPPFTRGHRLSGQSSYGWGIRQRHIHPDVDVCNRQILADIERGVTSVELVLDRAGQNGLDASRSNSTEGFGVDGSAIASVDDLDTLLRGVYLDACPVSLRAGASYLPVAFMFLELLERRGVDQKAFAGAFNADPLGTLAQQGALPGSAEDALAQLAQLAVYVDQACPEATAVAVDTSCYHDAGASEAQELAAALATGVSYLRAMTDAGLSVEKAFDQIAFGFSVDANLFLSIAKLRAACKVWGRVAEACGSAEAVRGMRLHATTSMRMLSRRDPWVNILRGTVAALGASVAGVDNLTVLPFTSAIGLPDDTARRIARNTQLVLQQESSLSRVVDPAGGSWAIENLTEEIAQEAWSLFQEIERGGGMLASLRSGQLQTRIATVAEGRARRVANLSDPLTGTSAFPNLGEQPVAVEEADLGALRDRVAGSISPQPIDKIALGDGCAALKVAVSNGASLANLVDALSDGEACTVEPLVRWRLGEAFEALRDASAAFQTKTGAPPQAFLAAVGSLSRFTAPAAYARNFLAAGGIDVIVGGGGTDMAAIAEAFKASGAPVAVICSDKAGLGAVGDDLVAALSQAGAREVFVAARPGDWGPASGSVAGYLYDGCDVRSVLQGILERMGILQR